MRNYSHNRRAEEAGRSLGAAVHRLISRKRRVARVGQLPVAFRLLLWATGIAIVALLALFAVWVALVVVLAWAAVKVSQFASNTTEAEFELTDPNDHRKSLFYHPLSFNDDPDPRFPDPRFRR